MDGAAGDAPALAALLARPAASPAGMETREAAAPEDVAEQLQRQRGHCSSPGDLSRLVPTPPALSSGADLFGHDDAACGSQFSRDHAGDRASLQWRARRLAEDPSAGDS